ASAQQLRTTVTNTVGVIVSDINNEFYFNSLSTLESTLNKMNKNLLLAFSSENPAAERDSFQSLIASRVTCIIFTPVCSTNHAIIETAKQNGIKVIQLFRKIYDDIDTIINDDESGCYLATQHLLQENCKRLLLIEVKYDYLDFDTVTPKRSDGFVTAITEYGDKIEHKVLHYPLIQPNISVLSSYITTFQPDGIIAGVNASGLHALKCLKLLGLIDKVKIVIFDDDPWLEFGAITAVKQNLTTVTDAICNCLSIIDGKQVFEKVQPSLIVRNT
ncbi:MAG: LacI family DNA-binding transcriptional regulator, partial [Clostridia bacterium]